MSKSANHHREDTERGAAGGILEELRAVVSDAEALLRETEGQRGERMEEVRTRVEETLESARGRLEDAAVEKSGRMRDAARSAQEYVRENPWTALIIAAAVGYLLGAGRRR